MGKGIMFSTIAKLFLILLVLIFLLPLLIRTMGPVWDMILEGLWIVRPSPFEKAIRCAYLRCTEGCLHTEVKEKITWKEDGKTVWCNDFCELKVFIDNDNRVCGWNAIQYPVEISGKLLNDGKTYSKKIGGIEFTCVTPLDAPQWRDIREILKTSGVLTGVTTACLGALMTYAPAGLITCPLGGAVMLALAPKYDMLVLAPELIKRIADEHCTPALGEKTYESVKEFTLKPVDGTVYIFVDRAIKEIPGLYKFEDVKTVTALSIPTYTIIPQKEERQVQLVRDVWNRIVVEGVDGDILVKPKTGVYIHEERHGMYEITYLSSTIRCPDGEEKEGLGRENCAKGERFCGDKVIIKCLDISNLDKLSFAISYGYPKPGVELYEKEEFKGNMLSLTSDADNLGTLNNRVSSVKLPPGWKATLYENKDYKGKNIMVAGNSSSLGLGDAVSSIFIPRGCSATIYEHEEYKGASRTLTSSISNLQDLTGPCSWQWSGWWRYCPCKFVRLNCQSCWNDCISSIEVKEGCNVTLYEGPDYKGNYVVVSGRSSSLHFNNEAESIKITKPVVR